MDTIINKNLSILNDVRYYSNSIKNVDLYTIGCELSQWDGERIIENLLANQSEKCIVFNTCAVTLRAQKASEYLIKLLDDLYPATKKYIVGCGVNHNYEYYSSYGICLKNEDKFNCKMYHKNYNTNLYTDFKHSRFNNDGAILKIQDGCNSNCSYCIVSKLRSVLYSLPYHDIYNQISNYISYNRYKINIVGTEICKYFRDNMKISDLLKKIITDFPKIKLSLGAIDPASSEVEKIVDLIYNNPNNFDKDVILSTQSACDTILRLMRRRHDVKRLEYLVNYGKERGIRFGYHIIPGFPGETEELFQVTFNNLKRFKPSCLHVMSFSARKGTPAYDMIQNNTEEVIEKRKQLLYSIVDQCNRCRDVFKIINYDSIKNTNVNIIDDLHNMYTCYLNIYDINEIKKLVSKLKPNQSYDNITLVVDYNDNIDYDIFEILTKFLSVTFNINLITCIKINDSFVSKFLNKSFDIKEFSNTNNSYLYFVIDDNINDIDKLVKCIVKLQRIVGTDNILEIINSIKCKEKFDIIKKKLDFFINYN